MHGVLRMHLVQRELAFCILDATLIDKCSPCRITLFSAMLAIKAFVVGYIVGLMGAKVGHVSAMLVAEDDSEVT